MEKFNIIIVDDNGLLLKEFKKSIEFSSIARVHTAQSLQEFQVYMSRYNIDLIITDSQVRDLNTQKFIKMKEYLSENNLKEKYIIFLNYDARCSEEEKEQNDIFFDEVFVRPFRMGELKEKISKYFPKRYPQKTVIIRRKRGRGYMPKI